MLGPKVRVQASFYQGSISPLDRAKGRPALGRLTGFTLPFSSPAHSLDEAFVGPGHMPPGAHPLLADSDLAIEIFECFPKCVKLAQEPRWALPPPQPLGGRHSHVCTTPGLWGCCLGVWMVKGPGLFTHMHRGASWFQMEPGGKRRVGEPWASSLITERLENPTFEPGLPDS